MFITPAKRNPLRNKGQPAPSPFGFQNLPDMEHKMALDIQGHVPLWLSGVMYRSGTGKYNILLDNGDTAHISHPFDGLTMLHRFEIHQGQAWYSSRHTAHGVERRIASRDPTLMKFGPDPCKTIFGRLQSMYLHISKSASNAASQEEDPEFEMVNITITPNFPIGPKLEKETNTRRGHALVAKRDANNLQLVDPDTLEPLRLFTYGHLDENIQGQLSASHHQSDPDTNEFVNFVVKLGPIPSFQLFSIGPYLPTHNKEGEEEPLPEPEVRLFEPIWRHLGAWKTLEPLKASYVHSFSMTKNFIVVPHYPYYYSVGGLSAIYYSSAYQAFHWDDTRHTLFHVINRKSGRHVATYEAEPCFAFHSINAWDTKETVPGSDGVQETVIYLDYCMYDNADIIDASFEYGKSPSGRVDPYRVEPAVFMKRTHQKSEHRIAPAQVRRYRLGRVPDADGPTARAQRLRYSIGIEFNQRRVASYDIVGHDLEMPRINSHYGLKPYRYVWGVCESRFAPAYAAGTVVNGLVKLDLHHPYPGAHHDEASSACVWDQPGCSCSEPIFVPRPGATEEDDGAVLSIVNNDTTCFLLILDAATMNELGRTTFGNFNTLTFHGSFVDHRGMGVAAN